MAEIIIGDYHVDEETGEVLGFVKEEFHVTDLSSAEWVLEKMQESKGTLAGLEARQKAITEQIEAMKKKEEKRLEFLQMRFGSELQEFAAKQLEGRKERTFKTVFGNLSFRKTPGKIEVTDKEAALAWAKENAPEAVSVKVTESVLVSKLDGEYDHLPATCFNVVAPSETFKIDTGV